MGGAGSFRLGSHSSGLGDRPEPLVVFTAAMAESDPRLRDEVLDWCIRNWRHVSQTRLRHILTRQSEETLDDWGRLAATVNARAGTHRPHATTERTTYKATGRSTLRPLTEPSLVLLRMRTMFGLSARTEILRYFLFHPWQRATAAMLAESANYAKRNVADACDMLAQAGVLSSKGVGNRFYFSLAPGDSLADFVGAVTTRCARLERVTSCGRRDRKSSGGHGRSSKRCTGC